MVRYIPCSGKSLANVGCCFIEFFCVEKRIISDIALFEMKLLLKYM